jgi:hypothetical protein
MRVALFIEGINFATVKSVHEAPLDFRPVAVEPAEHIRVKPFHSLRIDDPIPRGNLIWMVLLGLIAAHFLPPPPDESSDESLLCSGVSELHHLVSADIGIEKAGIRLAYRRGCYYHSSQMVARLFLNREVRESL